MTRTTAAARCKSCHAAIYWLESDTTGNRAPIDAAPSTAGNVLVMLDLGTYRVFGPERAAIERNQGAKLHRNHFGTCPHASQHRR